MVVVTAILHSATGTAAADRFPSTGAGPNGNRGDLPRYKPPITVNDKPKTINGSSSVVNSAWWSMCRLPDLPDEHRNQQRKHERLQECDENLQQHDPRCREHRRGHQEPACEREDD